MWRAGECPPRAGRSARAAEGARGAETTPGRGWGRPRPLTPGAADGTRPDAAIAQPAGWADTGILPASADESPPEDPGLVKVSVPEARRLLHLASTPMSAAARQICYAWSRWRRKHQARARYHHFQARLRACPG